MQNNRILVRSVTHPELFQRWPCRIIFNENIILFFHILQGFRKQRPPKPVVRYSRSTIGHPTSLYIIIFFQKNPERDNINLVRLGISRNLANLVICSSAIVRSVTQPGVFQRSTSEIVFKEKIIIFDQILRLCVRCSLSRRGGFSPQYLNISIVRSSLEISNSEKFFPKHVLTIRLLLPSVWQWQMIYILWSDGRLHCFIIQ